LFTAPGLGVGVSAQRESLPHHQALRPSPTVRASTAAAYLLVRKIVVFLTDTNKKTLTPLAQTMGPICNGAHLAAYDRDQNTSTMRRTGRGGIAFDGTRSPRVDRLINEGHTRIIEADLADYFGSIPHAELLKSVARRVFDRHGASRVASISLCMRAAANTPVESLGACFAHFPSDCSLPRFNAGQPPPGIVLPLLSLTLTRTVGLVASRSQTSCAMYWK
jgi:hypothetical protein